VKQAHERIIGERLVPNADKILSLYDADLHVIVRGKAGAAWSLATRCDRGAGGRAGGGLASVQESAPADSGQVPASLERLVERLGPTGSRPLAGSRL